MPPNWTEESMKLAIEAIQSGETFRAVGERFGIPTSSIRGRISSQHKLCPRQEALLAHWVVVKETVDDGPSDADIISVAQELLRIDETRKHVGPIWLHFFGERKPGLAGERRRLRDLFGSNNNNNDNSALDATGHIPHPRRPSLTYPQAREIAEDIHRTAPVMHLRQPMDELTVRWAGDFFKKNPGQEACFRQHRSEITRLNEAGAQAAGGGKWYLEGWVHAAASNDWQAVGGGDVHKTEPAAAVAAASNDQQAVGGGEAHHRTEPAAVAAESLPDWQAAAGAHWLVNNTENTNGDVNQAADPAAAAVFENA